ncbi:putative late blight resistance protein homolog R1B-17 isoform X2 [Rhododendron vialii]|uniref:putative late blight resistance protein homolog R1B-17 isoform X2 n=1 Tax=Rhododendron vialii TaxID=182163 RepID=UPI00265DA1D7|nr:putative late blight resistance protein homolog R1B-17 isoform X2 [Rhododendron vialii]
MGDTAVDFFLETLKNLITSSNLDVIIDKKHQLQSLEEEIKYLRGFLKITEKKRNEHSEVMNLVMRIRDVVSEAENIVELFVVPVFKANHAPDFLPELQNHLSRWDKFFKFLEWSSLRKMFYCNYFQDHLFLDLGSVKKEIKALTAEVKKIYDENMYDINGVAIKKLKHSSTRHGGPSGGSNTSIVVEKKVVVGFKEEVETLMGKLHDIGEGGQLEIISIIGAGGGGKTTLAREVYDHPLTSQKFEIRAWVNVSQDYDKTMKRHLLIRILESTFPEKHEDYEAISADKLGERVHKCLHNRKYVIVMDDIWGLEAWNDIQRSFPKGCKGSKVLFTSRQLVHLDSIRSIHHYLAPLPKSCSWELLEKKVFGMKRCAPELVDIGMRIAEKCEGLPLAIVATAGILSTEDKTLDVWEEVVKHLSSTIAKNQDGCMEILELSYNHLPLHLKACFLYIGAHPKDYEIPLRELIWLWIAEGFIQQSDGGKSLEAIAEDYLIDLIDRSLVMVARKSESHGGIKACHIHDLLRELCLKKAEEDNFFVKIYEGDSFSPPTTNKHGRLFIGHQFFSKFPPRPCARNLRSFLYLSLPNISHSSLGQNLSFFVENFKLLRVLHLISTTMFDGKRKLGYLVHLRYFANTLAGKTFDIPYSFHYLSNLETLNLQAPYGMWLSLPPNIVKMAKLRHLYSKKGIFNYHHDEEEGNMLDSLQTLHKMCMCGCCLRFLERTPNLRKLGLRGCLEDLLLPNLEFLKCLEILNVDPWFDKKHVTCTGLKLPPTLTRLTLRFTHLEWEELSIILQTLPSLKVLKLLISACSGPVWNTSELEEGFSQLKYLRLEDLDIEEWSASAEQFPALEVLAIQLCKKLKGIPIDFAYLNELCKIEVEGSSLSAEESAKEIQEEQINTKGDDDCVNLVLRYNQPNRG